MKKAQLSNPRLGMVVILLVICIVMIAFTTSKVYMATGNAACFLPLTNITLFDNATKEIQDINIGDEVLSYDFENEQNVKVEVMNVFSHQENRYMIINGNMKVTPNHMVYAK
ncbi:MAG: Hint domain-containing protein [Nanoarchaeota archaeon]